MKKLLNLINVLTDARGNAVGRKIKEKNLTITGLGITLTNNEIKDIMNVVRSIENRESLLERTTRKITIQEGGFLNFIWPFDHLSAG